MKIEELKPKRTFRATEVGALALMILSASYMLWRTYQNRQGPRSTDPSSTDGLSSPHDEYGLRFHHRVLTAPTSPFGGFSETIAWQQGAYGQVNLFRPGTDETTRSTILEDIAPFETQRERLLAVYRNCDYIQSLTLGYYVEADGQYDEFKQQFDKLLVFLGSDDIDADVFDLANLSAAQRKVSVVEGHMVINERIARLRVAPLDGLRNHTTQSIDICMRTAYDNLADTANVQGGGASIPSGRVVYAVPVPAPQVEQGV